MLPTFQDSTNILVSNPFFNTYSSMNYTRIHYVFLSSMPTPQSASLIVSILLFLVSVPSSPVSCIPFPCPLSPSLVF